MRALVMAAGLGTRLRPLTENLPKPLVPVRGRPMVEFVLDRLALAGVREAVINIHYLPEKMVEFVEAWNGKPGVPRLWMQDESGKILGSGGAVSLAADWLFESEDLALVCNSDVIASPDFSQMVAAHRAIRARSGVECTLAVLKNSEAGVKYTGLRVRDGLVLAFEKTGKADPDLWHFPGFYLLQKEAIQRLPSPGADFGILETLWRPLIQEKRLGAWEYSGQYFDLGSVEDLEAAERALGPERG